MRKHLLLAALFFLPTVIFSQKKTASKTTVYDLEEALKQNLVSLEIKGTGGYLGPSLKVVCKNLKGKFLRLRIPQGQFMEPADSSFQTLVVAETQTIAVGTKNPAVVTLKTFCAQAGDRSPSSGSVFAIGALAPENLRKLLKFIVEKGKVNSPEAQSAVWCVTGGGSLGSIGDPELTIFTAELLGKKAPGYKIIREVVRETPGERAELGKALVVEGNYTYFLEKDEKLVMNLLDAEGKLVKQISKEELMKAGEHRSSFNLQVWNLTPGKYIVRVQTKAGRVIKDIEVAF
ncbi:MAG: hypothetical protein OHK0019_00940 [Saprospiraceae bacterium]